MDIILTDLLRLSLQTSHVIFHYDEDGTAKVSLSPVVPTATTQTK